MIERLAKAFSYLRIFTNRRLTAAVALSILIFVCFQNCAKVHFDQASSALVAGATGSSLAMLVTGNGLPVDGVTQFTAASGNTYDFKISGTSDVLASGLNNQASSLTKVSGSCQGVSFYQPLTIDLSNNGAFFSFGDNQFVYSPAMADLLGGCDWQACVLDNNNDKACVNFTALANNVTTTTTSTTLTSTMPPTTTLATTTTILQTTTTMRATTTTTVTTMPPTTTTTLRATTTTTTLPVETTTTSSTTTTVRPTTTTTMPPTTTTTLPPPPAVPKVVFSMYGNVTDIMPVSGASTYQFGLSCQKGSTGPVASTIQSASASSLTPVTAGWYAGSSSWAGFGIWALLPQSACQAPGYIFPLPMTMWVRSCNSAKNCSGWGTIAVFCSFSGC